MVFLNNEFTVLDRELLTQNDNLGVHDRDIDALRTALDALRRDIGPMDERVHSQDARLRELEEEVKKHNDHTDELLKLLHREIEENDSKISQMQMQMGNLPTGGGTIMNVINNNSINELMAEEPVPVDESALEEIRRRLNKHDQALMRINELYPRTQTAEEEIQRIWEKLDELKANGGSQPEGGSSSVDQAEMEAIRAQIRNIQSTLDQMETQNMLMGAIGGGEMDENKMAIILSEIQKVQSAMNQYVLVSEQAIAEGKLNARLKQQADAITDSADKVRREFTNKVNLKLDVSEALKIVNEINFLKEQLQLLGTSKNGSQHNSQQNVSQTMDPNTSAKIKDLQDQLHNLEKYFIISYTYKNSEVKNHRIQYNGFVNNQNTKITEIEKKLQSLQLDRIFQEMQLLREITD